MIGGMSRRVAVGLLEYAHIVLLVGPRRPRRGLADERDGCVASPSGSVDPSDFGRAGAAVCTA